MFDPMVPQIAFWMTVIFVGALCFVAGMLHGTYRERREVLREQSRLKQILAAQEPRNGQRASHRAPSARARITSANFSRSTTPFQSKVSRERRSE